MSVEAKLDQIITNQATIISNQAAMLKAIDSADSAAVTAALATMETQVTAIQATIGSEPAPTAAP